MPDTIIPQERIERRIFVIRRHKVMLDRDLARLYGVPTFRLNEAMKRNRKRFPPDFMFQLTDAEMRALISQFAISNDGRGGRRTNAYAFTEQGVAMLSSVLHSDRAVQINIAVMRAFVKLRELMASHQQLARKIILLERKYAQHGFAIVNILAAIKALAAGASPPPSRRPMGFSPKHDGRKRA